MHWATTRAPADEALTILAIDHRGLFETLIDSGGGDEDRVATFKDLASQAMERTAAGDRACGLLLDGRFGARALAQSADAPYWIGGRSRFRDRARCASRAGRTWRSRCDPGPGPMR
jgi:5-dehydro-2-deoxygluconokinase